MNGAINEFELILTRDSCALLLTSYGSSRHSREEKPIPMTDSHSDEERKD